MSVRQKLNDRPALTIGLVVILVAASVVVFMFRPTTTEPPARPSPSRVFFSDDEGATWFPEDPGHIPPFTDAKGKEAYRAIVYRCADGRAFVGRLEGYDAEGRAQVEAAIKQGTSPAKIAMASGDTPFREWVKVKRPMDKSWSRLRPGDPASEAAFRQALQPACPDGNLGGARPVWPDDEVPSPQ